MSDTTAAIQNLGDGAMPQPPPVDLIAGIWVTGAVGHAVTPAGAAANAPINNTFGSSTSWKSSSLGRRSSNATAFDLAAACMSVSSGIVRTFAR